MGVPIVAILDTNSDPEGIDYPIPGNDDARRSIDLYCKLLKETIENAKNEAPNEIIKKEEIKNTSPEKSKQEYTNNKLN